MCGIFGLAITPKSGVSGTNIHQYIRELFLLSEARGREAAGLLVATESSVRVFKRALPAHHMLNSPEYATFIRSTVNDASIATGLVVIGHSRLVTNGTHGVEANNQPVQAAHSVGVHNGIIVNDSRLWAEYPSLERLFTVDTEIVYRLLDHFCSLNGNDVVRALCQTYKKLEGEANLAFVTDAERNAYLATNVGSLFYMPGASIQALSFASERYFLKRFALKTKFSAGDNIEQLSAGYGLEVTLSPWSVRRFSLQDCDDMKKTHDTPVAPRPILVTASEQRSLTRCAKCILPHTFPLIKFDQFGVCNLCRESERSQISYAENLEERLAPFRRSDGGPDCIVALSGGRDSCYGLHIIKKQFGMNPIAYTYDWAMVTDEARRNCARVCGALGVEHIIRSADIQAKRRNIKLNIEAWLRRPNLGMVPLFMAGDKQFFYYASQVSKETQVPLVVFCGGNNLEITRFKTGFCGVGDNSEGSMVGLNNLGKIKLFAFYAKQVLLNPRYLNRSLFDSLFAFYSTYIQRGSILYLYRYVRWNESEINSTLKEQYRWESAENSETTWRIGDGTAAFYNYIYHTVAGFSEHDTFRSNQIRAGLLSREKALQLIELENQPRYEAMEQYAQMVGFSLEEALVTINNIPKLT